MVSYENFYGGSKDGLEPEYSSKLVSPSGKFGITTDARSANVLKEVFSKLGTGAKVIELSGVSPEVMEAIPNQHLEELNRLRKLAGAELTLHGPIIEATGIGKSGWDEFQRAHAQNQMWSAVERSHRLDPKGNVIVTLHSSAGLPETTQKVMTEDGKEITMNLAVVDERTGRFGMMPKPTKEYFEGKEITIEGSMDKLNQDNWNKALSNLNFVVARGRQGVTAALGIRHQLEEKEPSRAQDLVNLYRTSIENPKAYQQEIEKVKKENPFIASLLQGGVEELNHSDISIKDAYNDLKELYNQAYEATLNDPNEKTRQEAKKQLEEFRGELAPHLEKYRTDPSKLQEFSEEVSKGVRLLSSLKAPEVFRPLKDFAIKKASETFSNVAFDSFKKFGNTSPIISIENPPVGMGLSRGEELKELVEAAREKFAVKAEKELGLSKQEAKEQAKKLIGATWDVGHINMLRKYGYGEKELLKQTEKIAPFVKHVHLSDNFGMEHTELPMGMGNVPTGKEMEIIEKYNKVAKKIVETGPWYQHFQISPLKKTFEAFGSPIYVKSDSPSWKDTGMMGDYFTGQGQINPEIHHSYFGAGFTTLPTELGGQMPGAGQKSRFSGTPME